MEPISLKVNTSGITYLAFFDLDRTIIGKNSGKVLIRQAYKKGLLTRPDMIKGIGLSLLYRSGLKDTAKIISIMVSWLKEVSETTLNEIASEIFEDHILKSIHSEVLSEISYHKKRGAQVIILSSAIRPICQKVAEYLSFDDIICSELEIRNGIYSGQPQGKLCFGEEKVARLTDYCNDKGISTMESWYYGDSISDLPVLTSVGNPRCVNPDKKLAKEANKLGWKIISWKCNILNEPIMDLRVTDNNTNF